MYDDLRNRVAIITGAGSGIGRACALRLSQEGCRLVLNDIDAISLEATRALLLAPDLAVGLVADIGAPETADGLSALALESFGELHIWVNNAALVRWGPVADCRNDDWDAVFRVTLDGAFFGIRSAISAMRRNQDPDRGCIINIASGAALAGEEGLGAYGAAKAALVNLTRTTAVEHAKEGIRCNVILPGPIATPGMLAAATQAAGRDRQRDLFPGVIPGQLHQRRQPERGRRGLRPDQLPPLQPDCCWMKSSSTWYRYWQSSVVMVGWQGSMRPWRMTRSALG